MTGRVGWILSYRWSAERCLWCTAQISSQGIYSILCTAQLSKSGIDTDGDMAPIRYPSFSRSILRGRRFLAPSFLIQYFCPLSRHANFKLPRFNNHHWDLCLTKFVHYQRLLAGVDSDFQSHLSVSRARSCFGKTHPDKKNAENAAGRTNVQQGYPVSKVISWR